MIDGLHFVKSRKPGKPLRWYVYAWRGGPCVMRVESPTKPKLTKEALQALSLAHDDAKQVKRDTLEGLSRQWRSPDPKKPSSPEWEGLSSGTKKTWGSQLNAIEKKWGQTPLVLWNDPRMVAKVVAWRDSRAATPRAADIGITVLRALLDFGRLRGSVTINVANDIPTLYRSGSRAEIIWTEDDIARFTAKAIELERPQLVDGLRLAALTGLRRQDLVTLTWAQVQEFALVKKALKSSRRKRRFATMPRIPQLDALLEELRSRFRQEGVDTVLVNSFGRPWSGDGFGGSFNRVRDEAAIVHVDE